VFRDSERGLRRARSPKSRCYTDSVAKMVDFGASDSDSEARLRRELALTDQLLAARNAVIDLIPPCPIHGSQCLPYASDWIRMRVHRDEREGLGKA
jgi:hypothetical protein